MPISSPWEVLPTEAINPASLGIDKLSFAEIIQLMISEDRKVFDAVQRAQDAIARGAEMIANALRKKGRVIFVGAGTSGRLGVLEAAEIPPTFHTPPSVVQAIMAGGKDAVHRAVEGIEDRYEEGARAARRAAASDVVVGISASGATPFVRGALMRARKTGASIILITCVQGVELPTLVDLIISLEVGPEVIAGSTRLKAGTATKLVLNMLTTAAMVSLGKTYGNLMVDLKAGSRKLRDRGRRIVRVVTGLDDDAAHALLRRARGNVKAAIVMQKAGLSYSDAVARLRKSHGSAREVIG